MVIGSGGREHAIAWALHHAPSVAEVLVTPGNPGMADVATVLAARGQAGSSNDGLLAAARRERPDLVVVGPEAPLVAGLADDLRAAGIAVFGPGAAGARLEGSKSHAKAFMQRHGVPTAAHATFDNRAAALRHIDAVGAPIVVKDSHLAAGKGVTVADDVESARRAVAGIFDARDGTATPAEVVLEERLEGEEISVLAFVSDDGYRLMPPSRDYKRVGSGDTGPMTGGMGTVAPVPLSEQETSALVADVVEPTIAGLRAERIAYRGVLYIGVMRTAAGFRVLEFNVRFGDPEAQVLLPLLDTDLGALLAAVAAGSVTAVEPSWRDAHTACVVIAAPGYPGTPATGVPIRLPARFDEGVMLFHSGTAGQPLVTAGGRVLNVVATAGSLRHAVEAAYRAVDSIDLPGAVVRRDIGAGLG